MSGKKGSNHGNSVNKFLEIINSIKPNENMCLIWPLGKDKDGYGYYFCKRKTWITHRLIFTLKKNDIPKGLVVMHSCDTPACCNIDHLSLGTPSSNTKDMIKKNRHVKGSLVGTARLSELDAEEIRLKSLVKNGIELAKEYGVCKQTIYNILNRKTYVNASQVNERYQPVNPVIRIEL